MKRKAKRNNKRDVSYNEDRNAAPSKITGDAISERNNNTNASEPPGNEPDVERANETGLGMQELIAKSCQNLGQTAQWMLNNF